MKFVFTRGTCASLACLAMLASTHVLANGTADDGGKAFASVRPATDITRDPYAPCPEDGSGAFLYVTVTGLTNDEGNVRVQVYSDKPDEFLASGKKVTRVDVPTNGDGTQVCVPLPQPGKYAVAVMHDRNANGRADIFSEGFGFSNNPKLVLGPPDHEEVVTMADEGVTELDISLTYVFQLGEDKRKQHKRRR